MFVFNLKINEKKCFKIFFVIVVIFVVLIFAYSSLKIFNSVKKESENFVVTDNIPNDEYPIINSRNYTNILKAVHDNLNEYIGDKLCFTGYIYRISGFKDNQFVLARNMIINNESQSVVVGFLCEYQNAREFKDGEWVTVYATIKKGDFNGELPILSIDYIEKAEIPDDPFVQIPDNTYVPTSVIY